MTTEAVEADVTAEDDHGLAEHLAAIDTLYPDALAALAAIAEPIAETETETETEGAAASGVEGDLSETVGIPRVTADLAA